MNLRSLCIRVHRVESFIPSGLKNLNSASSSTLLDVQESDGDFEGNSQEASESEEVGSSDSETGHRKKKHSSRPSIPGERKSSRTCRKSGSMVRIFLLNFS